MFPRLLNFPHVSSYPVLLLLGMVAGWALARIRSRSRGIEPRHLDNIALMMPLLGLGGARFFARYFYAKLPLIEALQIWKGDGLVFYGGFLACIAGIVCYAITARLPLVKLLDLLAPSAALGLAFGRIGCFMAGCCWGDFCVHPEQLAALPPDRVQQVYSVPALSGDAFPLAMQFPPRSDVFKVQAKWGLISGDATASLPVHPVQLYEAVLAFALSAWLLKLSRTGRMPEGGVSVSLLAGYGLIRFHTELFRGDNTILSSGLTFSQVVSLWILGICLITPVFHGLRARSKAGNLSVSRSAPAP